MSNEHLSFNHPWSERGWVHQILMRIEQKKQTSVAPGDRTQLSTAMICAAVGMLAFVIAVDGYVLLRTM